MSENEPKITFKEWLKKQQEQMNKTIVRTETLGETASEDWKGYFNSFKGVFTDLHDLYWAVEFLYDKSKMASKESDNKIETIEQVMKKILGLRDGASEKEFKDRAEEFGKFVEQLIKKRKEWEAEEKEKEKYR